MLNRFRYILLSGILLCISLRSMSQLAMPDNVCIGAVKHYYVDPNPGSTYIWRVNEIIKTGENSNEIDITWTTSGTFTLDVQEQSAVGCLGPLRSGQVFVSPLPGLNAGLTVQPTCILPTGSIVLNGLPASGVWTLTMNPGSIITTGTGTSTTVTGLSPGNYSFTVKDGITNCSSFPTADITVNSQPIIPDAAGTITGPATFTPGANGVLYSVGIIGGAESYVWEYTGTGATINGTDGNVTINFSLSATEGLLKVKGNNTCGNGAESIYFIQPDVKTLNLTSVMLQGLYITAGSMKQASDESGPHWPAGVADHITVELHSSIDYATIVYSVDEVSLSTGGTATLTVPYVYNESYYITIKHRNSLETVSSTARSFAGSTISQSFGTPTDVYGGNLKQMTGGYAIYAGEQNQDGLLDGSDLLLVNKQVTKATSGYIKEDVNGDGLTDGSDLNMLVKSVTLAISVIKP